jgi:hypothetical protein
MQELGQMMERRVWTAVKLRDLSIREKMDIIRSSMFLKMKVYPDGKLDKLKARLVAGGNQQDRTLYDDLSAPTVSTSAVLTILSVAAHERRKMAVVDIGGAFLYADMDTGILVHMRLDATMSGLLCRLDPRYRDFMDSRGCIVVRLDKALYGCVESAALWYDNLSQSMQNLGYECNEYEPCVFNRLDEHGMQCTATVHVDDLFISSRSPSMIEHLCGGLKTRYGEDGPVVGYLGMTFDLSSPGEARLTMHGYIQEVLKSSGVIGTAKTPATDGLFELRETSPKLTASQSKRFQRHVARIAYLAKRAKPECLPAVAFLSTRVTCCDEDDMDKLIRLLKYLRESEDRGLVLRPGTKGITVRVFVDAAYGVHADTKSHTGSYVVIGDTGSVHCKSTKQSIMTKSSTEAELVALSDSANQGLFLRNFLHHQGYDMGPVILYQDNMSTMGLVARGRSGAEKTRHILIRYYWVSEQVANGTAIVEHKGTKARNLLTRPLQGSQFLYERECLTGWA